MKRTSILAALLAACGGEPALDAGTDAAARPDASAEPCAADAQCDDSLFCTVHRCLPGDPRADARGCVVASSPCAAGTTCEEATASCVPEVCGPDPDRDGDGHESLACGGNDCDDDDGDRYGGHVERCDGAHDEDCDDTTVAGASDGDADGDGATSNACCNGTTCGGDCDDADRAVFPGARALQRARRRLRRRERRGGCDAALSGGRLHRGAVRSRGVGPHVRRSRR